MNDEHSSSEAEPAKSVSGQPSSDSTEQNIEYSLSLIGHYSGPLPPANELAKYEEAVPGAGKVIVESFQEQQRHRMMLETRGQRNFSLGICCDCFPR